MHAALSSETPPLAEHLASCAMTSSPSSLLASRFTFFRHGNSPSSATSPADESAFFDTFNVSSAGTDLFESTRIFFESTRIFLSVVVFSQLEGVLFHSWKRFFPKVLKGKDSLYAACVCDVARFSSVRRRFSERSSVTSARRPARPSIREMRFRCRKRHRNSAR